MDNYVLDPQSGLPIPTIAFPNNIHRHLQKLGYDRPGGLEYDWGNCAHAVSSSKCERCSMS